MAQIDDLKAQLDGLVAEVEQTRGVDASILAVVDRLEAALGNIAQAPDLQSAIDQVEAVRATLTSEREAIAAAVQAAPPTP